MSLISVYKTILQHLKKLTLKQSLIIASSVVLISIMAISCSSSHLYMISKTSSFSNQKLKCINGTSSKGIVNPSECAFYIFPSSLQKVLLQEYKKNGSLTVSVKVNLPSVSDRRYLELVEDQEPFYFGFLNEGDLDKHGFTGKVEGRVLTGVDLRALVGRKSEGDFTTFEAGIAIEKKLEDSALPKGIIVYSTLPIKIEGFYLNKANIGYDFTGNNRYFAYACNGGFYDFSQGFDFSGSASVFSIENTEDSVMPLLDIGFTPLQDYGTSSSPKALKLNIGGESLTVYRTPSVSKLTLQTEMLKSPFNYIKITDEARAVSRLIMEGNDDKLISSSNRIVYPLPVDPGLLPGSKATKWRNKEYELYSWDRFPNVLFFDTCDYEVQSQFFRRLAFYAEKTGYKGRLLTDKELGNMHGYNAHDYSAETLARFFNEARRLNFPLNDKENLLKEILLTNKLLKEENGLYDTDGGAIISISQDSASWLRVSLCAHEIWHGLFFTDEDFRNTTAAIYYTLDSSSLSFLKGYWQSQAGLGYDQSDLYLMQNEFMAYTIQQPLGKVSEYFLHLANRGSVIDSIPKLCQYVRKTNAQTFEDVARVFDSFVYDKWGLNCGRVALVTR